MFRIFNLIFFIFQLLPWNHWDEIRDFTPMKKALIPTSFDISTYFDSVESYEWNGELWPHGNLDEIDLKFRIFTAHKPYKETLFRFDPNNPTVPQLDEGTKDLLVLIHGWRSGFTPNGWMAAAKDRYTQENLNVVVVDWSTGAKLIYPRAAANLKIIGAVVALFLQKMMSTYRIAPSQVAIAGHSLGAHAAGFTAKAMQRLKKDSHPKLIFAMDPAGPIFELLPPSARLNATDAKIVYVFHTNARVYGISKSIGTHDFFLNGGFLQPGCKYEVREDLLNPAVFDSTSCSHSFATLLASENLDPLDECEIIGFRCNSVASLVLGYCTDCSQPNSCHKINSISEILNSDHEATRSLSFLTPLGPGLFMETNKEKPLCRCHYLFKLTVSTTTPTKFHGFKLTFIDTEGVQLEKAIRSHDFAFKPGESYQQMVTSKCLGKAAKAFVSEFSGIFGQIKIVYINSISLELRNNLNKKFSRTLLRLYLLRIFKQFELN